jgi:hypothetical protein
MATFTRQQKEEITAELVDQVRISRQKARINEGWDTAFKIILLLLTLATAICSIYITSFQDKPPAFLTIAVAIMAAVSTGLSAFAFSQFNFAGRRENWRKRADAFADMKIELLCSDIDKQKFLARLQEVRSWGDTTPPKNAHNEIVDKPGSLNAPAV